MFALLFFLYILNYILCLTFDCHTLLHVIICLNGQQQQLKYFLYLQLFKFSIDCLLNFNLLNTKSKTKCFFPSHCLVTAAKWPVVVKCLPNQMSFSIYFCFYFRLLFYTKTFCCVIPKILFTITTTCNSCQKQVS